MSEESQVPPQRRPKSLLETHQDSHLLIKALNEFAASQQMPKSPASTSPASEGPITKEIVKDPAVPIPILRRKLAHSEQPSVSKLLELGVKARDFAYESTLPPIPTVYRQPRQIQPSQPKDENDPNDPHYVLEEERKKRVFTLNRKIERTPTEPVLESDLVPPPRPTFPKLRRDDALLDISSQSPNDTPAASQTIQPLVTDSSQTEPWVDTPIVTPNGSLQWPVADVSTIPASQLDSDSQAPPPPEPMSYSQMGFSHPESSQPSDSLIPANGASTPTQSSSVGRPPVLDPGAPSDSPLRPATPSPPNSRQVAIPSSFGAGCAVVDPAAQERVGSPAALLSPPQSQQEQSPSPAPERSTPPAPAIASSSSPSSSSSSSSRYNLRQNKRAAGSPPSSPVPPHTRPRLTQSMQVAGSGKAGRSVSVKSAHSQGKSATSTLSSRPLKRERALSVSAFANGSPRETRSAKRKTNP